MPLLSEEDQTRLLVELGRCTTCRRTLRRNYCRQCDEFFVTGHKADCASATVPQHQGHRTYERPPMQKAVIGFACPNQPLCVPHSRILFTPGVIGKTQQCAKCGHYFTLTPDLVAAAVAEEIYEIGLAHGRDQEHPEEEDERPDDGWGVYAEVLASVFATAIGPSSALADLYKLPGAPAPGTTLGNWGGPGPSDPRAQAVLEFVNGLHAKLKAGVDVPALTEVTLGALEAVAKLILLFTTAPTPTPAPAPTPPAEG